MRVGVFASNERSAGSKPRLAIKGSKTVATLAGKRSAPARYAAKLMAVCLLMSDRSRAGRRRAPPTRVPSARRSYAAHVSKMQVWATASARDTIGGPSFDSRTPCRKASFQRRTTFPPLVCEDRRRGGLSRTRPPTPTLRRKLRREILSRKRFLPLVPGDPTAIPQGDTVKFG